MIQFPPETIKRVKEACAKHRVKSLWLYGSATRGDFDKSRSDVDAIVEFQGMDYRKRADHYFALRDELRALFGRPIDLIEQGAITNPYFREEVDRSRVAVYAA